MIRSTCDDEDVDEKDARDQCVQLNHFKEVNIGPHLSKGTTYMSTTYSPG